MGLLPSNSTELQHDSVCSTNNECIHHCSKPYCRLHFVQCQIKSSPGSIFLVNSHVSPFLVTLLVSSVLSVSLMSGVSVLLLKLLFMSILVEVLLLEKGNHFTKKLSLPYAQAFKTDVIFSLTKRTRLQFIIFIMKIIIFIIIFIMKRDRGIFFNAVASR